MAEVRLIKGNSFTDERGALFFVNDFDFKDVKRSYVLHHPSTTVVRAWQGHKIEHKYFQVIKGSFLIAVVRIDNWDKPSANLPVQQFVLTGEEACILRIPAGYANGIKALIPDSILVSYSNLPINEAVNDNIRFESSLWLDWNNLK